MLAFAHYIQMHTKSYTHTHTITRTKIHTRTKEMNTCKCTRKTHTLARTHTPTPTNTNTHMLTHTHTVGVQDQRPYCELGCVQPAPQHLWHPRQSPQLLGLPGMCACVNLSLSWSSGFVCVCGFSLLLFIQVCVDVLVFPSPGLLGVRHVWFWCGFKCAMVIVCEHT